jgi:hypothetical protein
VRYIEAEEEGKTNAIQFARITSKISDSITLVVRITLGFGSEGCRLGLLVTFILRD